MDPLSVLVVSYAFPPVGGAGVQRVLKLVKHLPLHGVTPTVLTVENPSTPLIDATLAAEVPSELHVLRAPSLEPGYAAKRAAWNTTAAPATTLRSRLAKRIVSLGRTLLAPDPQILWLPGSALALARRLWSDEADDVVFISGPPFSQFLLSAIARLRAGTACVLDYRDEWTTTRAAYEMGAGTVSGAWLERAVLSRAHVVTMATDEFRTELLRRFAFLDPSRVRVIPNGYDPEDFPEDLPEPPSDRFAVTYVGTVFRLTSAVGFLDGVRLLHRREPDLARLLDIRFIGRIVETEAASFGDAEGLGVTYLGYLPHLDALRELSASHLVLCLLADVEGADRILPAKIFEVMHLHRPSLVLAPEGALTRLVRRYGVGEVVAPNDSDAIAAALATRLRSFRSNNIAAVANAPTSKMSVDRFDRRHLAGEFADAFRDARALAREGLRVRGRTGAQESK